MTYTKERVADAAASARPYVERALRDKELRDNIRNAYSSARAVYDELSSRRRVSDAATQLAGDKEQRLHSIQFKNLAAGGYTLRAKVLSTGSVRSEATQEIMVTGGNEQGTF